MHAALLAVFLSAAPTPFATLTAKLPELSLPLVLRNDNRPREVAVSPDELKRVRTALSDFMERGNRDRVSENILQDSDEGASPPVHTFFQLFGKVPLGAWTGVVCFFGHTVGEGGPDDENDDAMYLAVFTPSTGALVDVAELYMYSSDGFREGRFDGKRIQLGQLTQTQQEGPAEIRGPALAYTLLPSGLICPAGEKRGAATSYRDPKSKEEVTFTRECTGRTSVAYRAGPSKPSQWLVTVAADGARTTVQFPASPKDYKLELVENDAALKCTNPDGTVQRFERVPAP